MPDAGRVITGRAGGLRLEAAGPGTRPLSDKVKQALFSLVEAERDDVWEHTVLDLFAGAGAAGIEALSRGAPSAVLVERDGGAAAVIRRNLERTGLAGAGRVVRRDVASFLADGARASSRRPSGSSSSIRRMSRSATWRPASSDWPPPGPAGSMTPSWSWPSTSGRPRRPRSCGELRRTRVRRFGETALSVYRRSPESAAGGS